MKHKKNKHFKHANKIMKWKGNMTNQRAHMVMDEIEKGLKEELPRYIVVKGFIIDLHNVIA